MAHPPLNKAQQFMWGAFGGVFVIFAKFGLFVSHLDDTSAPPHWNFKLWMLLIWWFGGIAVSGIVSMACESHNRFIAVYEGMSLPALFLAIAHELH